MSEDKPKDCRRVLAALVGLVDRYPVRRVEAACVHAIACADPRYMRVRDTLRNGLEDTVVPADPVTAPKGECKPPVYRYTRGAEEFFGVLAATGKGAPLC